MADTSRKRSRKSKLVPRECSLYEDDLELQLPETKIFRATIPQQPSVKQKTVNKPVKQPESTITKPIDTKLQEVDTSVLRKINASAKVDVEPKMKISPRKFEINIEVESCDDDDDEFASIRIENSLTTPGEDILSAPRTKPIPLSRERILEAADNILETSKEIADKILSIYVRNTIGDEQEEKLKTTGYEVKIQRALEDWRDWQYRSFHREDPLFYKCYICIKSWWFLSDFHNHMSSQHPNDERVKIIMEIYESHEVNLIAYQSKLLVVNTIDIYTEGLCHRCGKDFAAHELGGRVQEKFYSNKGCYKQFFSCMGLRDHLPTCPVCNVENKPFKCDICKSRFDTVYELNDHLVRSHSVRSDIPIMGHYDICYKCSGKYSSKYLHKCLQTGPHTECPNCFRTFSNTKSMELHLKRSHNKPYKCEICNTFMKYSCSKYEHMLKHTDRYMIVRKCVKCDGLNVFLNNDDAAAHTQLKHEPKDKVEQIYFPKILVPSSCVYQSLAESEMEEEESLVEEEELMLEGKESEATSELKRSAAEIMMNNVIVKEEPPDTEDTSGLVIKEEPVEEIENQTEEQQMENFDHEIRVKQEVLEAEEEIDEYEDDLIKLNFDIEDLLVKQEAIDDETEYSQDTSEMQTDNDESQEAPQPIKEEGDGDVNSILEPHVIILGGVKKKKNLYKCTKCGFTSNHRQYRAHIEFDCPNSIVKRNKHYECTKCNSTFKSMKKYLAHFERHGYKHKCCPDCLHEFNNYTALGQHVQMHIKQNFVRIKLITHAGKAMIKPDFQCKKCNKTIHISEFFEHWESHINAQPTLPMKVRSGPSLIRGELQQTIIKECIARLSKDPKECNHCHRWFKRVNECKRHIIEHLLADAYNQKHILQELRCQICEAGFAVQDKYKQHMRDHASLPVYKCELCDRTFSDSSNFTKHKKVHNLKVIICDLCGKKFQSKMCLEKHIDKHKTTDPITCELCNKIFYFESSYRRHIRYFHEKTTHGFRCVNCGARFESLKQKWDHMWLVHKERKQKADCPICHESFRKFSDVRAHARATHYMEVSVLSVKRASRPNTTVIDKFLGETTKIKVGKKETLVVYDAD